MVQLSADAKSFLIMVARSHNEILTDHALYLDITGDYINETYKAGYIELGKKLKPPHAIYRENLYGYVKITRLGKEYLKRY